MPKKSRDKGSRYERKIAKLFGKAFNRDLRRVPLSGGLDIKCDIYDPFNDDFPYFIECKHRETFTIESILKFKSELFKFMDKVTKDCSNSYLSNKYNTLPIPIVVFKGGNFKSDMVLTNKCYFLYTMFEQSRINNFNYIVIGDFTIFELSYLLDFGFKEPLQ